MKTQQGLTLIELMIVTVILIIFFRIAIKGNKAYEVRGRLHETLTETVNPLKTAINNCLKDNHGNINACNELGENKLGKYGISHLPEANGNFFATYLLKENAGIKIIGKQCIVNISPVKNNPQALWQLAVSTPLQGEFSLTDCKCAIYSRYLLQNYQVLTPAENCGSIWRFLY
jgi:prepilin-type N-terminal cleavage/methylation domain-containing protein